MHQSAHQDRRQKVSRAAHVAVKQEHSDDESHNSIVTLSEDSKTDTESINNDSEYGLEEGEESKL